MLSKHCTVQSMVHKAGLIRDTSQLGTILLNTDTNVDSHFNLLFGYSFSFYLLINLLDIDILLAQKSSNNFKILRNWFLIFYGLFFMYCSKQTEL